MADNPLQHKGLSFVPEQNVDGDPYFCIDCNACSTINEFEYCPRCWSKLPQRQRQVLTGEEVRTREVRVEVERHDHQHIRYVPVPRIWQVVVASGLLGMLTGAGGAWWMLRFGAAWFR